MKKQVLKKATVLSVVLVALSLMGVACHQETELRNEKVEVVVSFDNLEIGYVEDSPQQVQAQRVSDKSAADAGVNRIALSIFDSNNALVYSATKNATVDSENFDQVSCTLLPGTYIFVAVAHQAAKDDEDPATINTPTDATITTSRLFRTYSRSMQVNVLANQTNNVVVDFGQRVSSTFQFACYDETPDEVSFCRVIVKPNATATNSYSFDPSTGFTSNNYLYTYSQYKSNTGGTFTNKLFSVHCFLEQNPEYVDVVITMYDADGAVYRSLTLENVELAPHRITRAMGSFFHFGANSSFVFDTTEDDRLDITY